MRTPCFIHYLPGGRVALETNGGLLAEDMCDYLRPPLPDRSDLRCDDIDLMALSFLYTRRARWIIHPEHGALNADGYCHAGLPDRAELGSPGAN